MIDTADLKRADIRKSLGANMLPGTKQIGQETADAREDPVGGAGIVPGGLENLGFAESSRDLAFESSRCPPTGDGIRCTRFGPRPRRGTPASPNPLARSRL